ncbi:MAG: histidine phosphatase family protein, partial [Candidatus Absconditabacteria bacterium]
RGKEILKKLVNECNGNQRFKNHRGETLVVARKRKFSLIEKNIKKHQSGNILIVTHGLIFREFLKHHFPKDPIDQLIISNPDVYKIQVRNNKVISYDREESLIPENAITRAHS